MKPSFFLVFLLAVGVISSCKKTFDPGKTVAQKMANGWWVTLTQGGNDIYGLGTFFLNTYNTSGNTDSIWVDDIGHSWNFKCRAFADYSKGTFIATHASNDNNGDSTFVSITNGKVLAGAGKTKGGNISDSIYMQVSFSDDPYNYTYIISGTARTGFIGDDY